MVSGGGHVRKAGRERLQDLRSGAWVTKREHRQGHGNCDCTR